MDDGSWIADAASSYDRVAARYAELVQGGLADLPLESALVEHFARRVVASGDGPVLDAGCGPGQLTRHLASLGLSVSGLDISLGMLRIARRENPGLGFVAATLTQLPVADETCAGLLCWYVLHHVPDDLAHVKTEGYGGLGMRVHFVRRSADSHARLLRDAGLVVDATIALGPEDPAIAAIWLAHKPART